MATTDLPKLFLLSVVSGSMLLGACAAPTSISRDKNSKNVYAGFGIGGSFLKANTTDINLSQDNSASTAGQLVLGLDLNSSFALEGRVADLGKIEFTDGNELGYQVADVSGLYKFNNNKFNAYARAGIGTLSNSGDFKTRLDSPAHLVVGAGIGYRLTPRVSLRAEWVGHDIDVSHAQASFIFHFDNRTNTLSPSVASSNIQPDANQVEEAALNDDASNLEPTAKLSVPTIVPVPTLKPATQKPNTEINAKPPAASQANESAQLAIQSRPVAKPNPAVTPSIETAAVPETVSKPVAKPAEEIAEKPVDLADTQNMQNNSESAVVVVSDIQQPVSLDREKLALADTAQKSSQSAQDFDQDGINDASDNCPGSESGLAVAADGCSLFSRAVPGLTFWPNTDRLQRSAMTVLDSVASVLKDQPDMQLTVAAYTAQPQDAEAALFLTRRRIIAITRYLSDQGIDATRLRPEVLSDADAYGSAKNSADTASDIDADVEQVILTPR